MALFLLTKKEDMFEKTIHKLQYISERIVVWALRRVLYNYSLVLAREFGKTNQFTSEVVTVAADHWQKLDDLDSRISKLEGRA